MTKQLSDYLKDFSIDFSKSQNKHLVSWSNRNNKAPSLVSVYCVTVDWIL